MAAGFRPCLRCRPMTEGAETKRIADLCHYIEQNCAEALSLDVLSSIAGVTASHVQRTFQEAVGLSPRDYIDACRMRLFRQTLRRQQPVTRAMVDAGYSSTSRLYERTNQALGMTPSRYRSGAADVKIRYAIAETPLGWVIVAATEIGICCIQLAGDRDELLPQLAQEFPKALLQEDSAGLAAWMASVAAELAGTQPGERLPLDIRATAFQQRVWDYLRTIPMGETRSYSAVARDLGSPSSTRAVARACATNRIALLIPCHRVVKEDGGLAGYRWGIDRKKKLLENERS